MDYLLEQIDFQQANDHIFYQRIPWDSKYLNNTTCEVLSCQPEVPSQATLAKFLQQFSPGDLLFVKCVPTKKPYIQSLVQAGFYVIEESVEPHLDLTRWKGNKPLNDNFHLRAIRNSEVEHVSQLSAEAFTKVSRYFLDPTIPRAGVKRRYADWVRTSLANGEDVQVLVNAQDQIAGFFITQYAGSTADNRLIALDPAWRGQGLGKELYVRMLQQAQTQGATQFMTHTAKHNAIAMKVYTDLGASFQHPQVVLHYVI